MSDVEESVSGTVDTRGLVPGPDTFNFEDYVVGKSTFPTFKHTVYLDQEAGARLQDLIDESGDLEAKIKKYENDRSDRLGLSMVDDSTIDVSEVYDRLKAVSEEMKELEKEIKSTGLTLVFQVSTVDKLTTVVREAEKAFIKKHGRGADDDISHMSLKSRYILMAQLKAYCIKVISSEGIESKPPSEQGFGVLLDRLISSESVRLLQSLNKGLDSGTTWAEKVDAGFPGGGAVVA